jgi:hypothetical protein
MINKTEEPGKEWETTCIFIRKSLICDCVVKLFKLYIKFIQT